MNQARTQESDTHYALNHTPRPNSVFPRLPKEVEKTSYDAIENGKPNLSLRLLKI